MLDGSIRSSWIGIKYCLNIAKDYYSVYTVTMDSPDQGVTDIPVDEIKYESNYVEFKLEDLNRRFEGYIKNDTFINGKWFQNQALFDLDLFRQEQPFELKRPQEPKPPYPYDEEEISIKNESADLELSGTLTIPNEGVNFPAVIMVTGS